MVEEETNGSVVHAEAIKQDIAENGKEEIQTKQVGYLSISPDNLPLKDSITECLKQVQNHFDGIPLWVIIHDGDDERPLSNLSEEVWDKFYRSAKDFNNDEPILLLLISPGGDAESAYRIAKFLRHKSKHFTVILPSMAKSAATLLALGANEVFIGKDADMGPLDVQILDHNEERNYSALDEVQAIDGLFDFATTQIIQTTSIWSRAMRKKKQSVFPSVIEYVVGMMKPLMDKIDTVHYMYLSRTLRNSRRVCLSAIERQIWSL